MSRRQHVRSFIWKRKLGKFPVKRKNIKRGKKAKKDKKENYEEEKEERNKKKSLWRRWLDFFRRNCPFSKNKIYPAPQTTLAEYKETSVFWDGKFPVFYETTSDVGNEKWKAAEHCEQDLFLMPLGADPWEAQKFQLSSKLAKLEVPEKLIEGLTNEVHTIKTLSEPAWNEKEKIFQVQKLEENIDNFLDRFLLLDTEDVIFSGFSLSKSREILEKKVMEWNGQDGFLLNNKQTSGNEIHREVSPEILVNIKPFKVYLSDSQESSLKEFLGDKQINVFSFTDEDEEEAWKQKGRYEKKTKKKKKTRQEEYHCPVIRSNIRISANSLESYNKKQEYMGQNSFMQKESAKQSSMDGSNRGNSIRNSLSQKNSMVSSDIYINYNDFGKSSCIKKSVRNFEELEDILESFDSKNHEATFQKNLSQFKKKIRPTHDIGTAHTAIEMERNKFVMERRGYEIVCGISGDSTAMIGRERMPPPLVEMLGVISVNENYLEIEKIFSIKWLLMLSWHKFPKVLWPKIEISRIVPYRFAKIKSEYILQTESVNFVEKKFKRDSFKGDERISLPGDTPKLSSRDILNDFRKSKKKLRTEYTLMDFLPANEFSVAYEHFLFFGNSFLSKGKNPIEPEFVNNANPSENKLGDLREFQRWMRTNHGLFESKEKFLKEGLKTFFMSRDFGKDSDSIEEREEAEMVSHLGRGFSDAKLAKKSLFKCKVSYSDYELIWSESKDSEKRISNTNMERNTAVNFEVRNAAKSLQEFCDRRKSFEGKHLTSLGNWNKRLEEKKISKSKRENVITKDSVSAFPTSFTDDVQVLYDGETERTSEEASREESFVSVGKRSIDEQEKVREITVDGVKIPSKAGMLESLGRKIVDKLLNHKSVPSTAENIVSPEQGSQERRWRRLSKETDKIKTDFHTHKKKRTSMDVRKASSAVAETRTHPLAIEKSSSDLIAVNTKEKTVTEPEYEFLNGSRKVYKGDSFLEEMSEIMGKDKRKVVLLENNKANLSKEVAAAFKAIKELSQTQTQETEGRNKRMSLVILLPKNR